MYGSNMDDADDQWYCMNSSMFVFDIQHFLYMILSVVALPESMPTFIICECPKMPVKLLS